MKGFGGGGGEEKGGGVGTLIPVKGLGGEVGWEKGGAAAESAISTSASGELHAEGSVRSEIV